MAVTTDHDTSAQSVLPAQHYCTCKCCFKLLAWQKPLPLYVAAASIHAHMLCKYYFADNCLSCITQEDIPKVMTMLSIALL